ncbi:MAG: hypothetical protein NC231_05845 [Bacillus sp. (in: Bacteria)]|nr:hypothetical protein [Bacillus sp. (in: firmicutes)]MCM1426865.1 hypothetical protein [Eubacterium sp.]
MKKVMENLIITYDIFRIMITALLILLMLLVAVMLHTFCYGMARIYNWNGSRYRYLGYVPVRKEDGGFAVRIGARMVDLSRTTLYRICPGRAFCRKNRYRDMYVYADGAKSCLVIEKEAMKTEIPF